LRNYYRKHDVNKLKQRNRAAERRRKEGKQEVGKYKRKQGEITPKPRDVKLDLALKYGPRK
jgi:hypothetical protein